MITVSYNAYCAISKEGDNDIWTVRRRGVVPLLSTLCSQIDVRATVNALLGDTFSHENNMHGSRFHKRDPQFASQILGAMTQSCYIGTCDIRSRVIRSPYCIWMFIWYMTKLRISWHLECQIFVSLIVSSLCVPIWHKFYSAKQAKCRVYNDYLENYWKEYLLSFHNFVLRPEFQILFLN